MIPRGEARLGNLSAGEIPKAKLIYQISPISEFNIRTSELRIKDQWKYKKNLIQPP
uniref:Wzc n=1 Tax=Vibrio parahaemolyticus TaxID=670 RepID=A0A5P9WA28_VIBPH|nr:Wzc [Vibrio parahaemolyticus]